MVESKTRPDSGMTLKAYKDSLKNQTPFSKQFEDNHVEVDDSFKCLIMQTAADIPVNLSEYQDEATIREFCFDYQGLKQWYFTNITNPITDRRITWSDVEPAPELVEEMRKELQDAKQQSIKLNRKAAF